MKASLQSIDTTDSYYLNYNKTKFEKFINNNFDVTKTDAPILDDSKIIELTNAAKPNQKIPVTFNLRETGDVTFYSVDEAANGS